MNKDDPLEDKIPSLSQEECFDTLISMIKDMSREELTEFADVIKTYKALQNDKN